MTITIGPSRAARVRTTMPLSKAHSKHHTSLSFDAALALAYGLRAISAVSPQTPHESSITRRALELYGRSLSDMTPDQLRAEGRAVAESSKAFGLPADEQEEAFERLEAIDIGLPLPGLLEVRNGPHWAPMDIEALDAKVDEMVRQMPRSNFHRKAVAS